MSLAAEHLIPEGGEPRRSNTARTETVPPKAVHSTTGEVPRTNPRQLPRPPPPTSRQQGRSPKKTPLSLSPKKLGLARLCGLLRSPTRGGTNQATIRMNAPGSTRLEILFSAHLYAGGEPYRTSLYLSGTTSVPPGKLAHGEILLDKPYRTLLQLSSTASDLVCPQEC